MIVCPIFSKRVRHGQEVTTLTLKVTTCGTIQTRQWSLPSGKQANQAYLSRHRLHFMTALKFLAMVIGTTGLAGI